MKIFDIITVGSAVIDAFLDTGLDESNGKICFPVEVKLKMRNLWFATGGDGTNTAVAFSKLGLKTGYLGKLGRDENAKIILDELEKEKVTFLGVQGKEPTGYAVIIDSNQHNRTILSYGGANTTFSFNEIDLNKLKTRWFYFSLGGRTMKTQEKLIKWASSKGMKIAYNPGTLVVHKDMIYLKGILKHIEILILNEEEARSLIKSGDLFKGLHRLGPKIVCVTYGKEGNAVYDGNDIYISKPHNIKVKERTGAGDAFASGFVFGLMKFNDLKKAIQIGALNAESVIQKPGAKNGLLTWKEVEKRIKKNPVKIEVKAY